MKDSICVRTLQCLSREFIKDGQCVKVPVECITFNPDGACTACLPLYSLVDGECKQLKPLDTSNSKCISPCSTCLESDQRYCLSCLLGFKLNEGSYGSCISAVAWVICLFIFSRIVEGNVLLIFGLGFMCGGRNKKDCSVQEWRDKKIN